MAMESSINQEGFGGSGGISSFDLWPPLPHSIEAMVPARVAQRPTCGKPDRAGTTGKHFRGCAVSDETSEKNVNSKFERKMNTSNKKLKLNKHVVANLNNNELKQMAGGYLWTFFKCTTGNSCGCTDGCTSVGGNGGWHTKLNCSDGQCSADCSCATRPLCDTRCKECQQQ